MLFSLSEGVKTQYLSCIFSTNYCVLDEKYSRKLVYIVYCKFWRGEKKDENTANAASNYIHVDSNVFTFLYSTLTKIILSLYKRNIQFTCIFN